MTRPSTICLNMIVKNESHVICRLFDSVLPYISSWVIVDTGSTDGTQEVIRDYFEKHGVTGVLHERPWKNFADNRTEALQLAQGHAEYIIQMDADDVFCGTPDFNDLTADAYLMKVVIGGIRFWRRHVFRDGVPWHWEGVLHERSVCDEPYTEMRLGGDAYIDPLPDGSRSHVPDKYLRDAEIMLGEVIRDPENSRSVFYLAQSYRDHGDLRSARQWYTRRAEMGGKPDEVYFSMLRVAECTEGLEDPWPLVQDAYLRAWAYRPTRAEGLCRIASHYRHERKWELGYFFAKEAAQLPVPDDVHFVYYRMHEVTAVDEQAICASWLGKHEESFALCRQLLERDDLDDGERGRISANRDFAVPHMLEISGNYPQVLPEGLSGGPMGDELTVTMVAGPDRDVTARALNSFLNCCSDISRAGRFLMFDLGLGQDDRSWLTQHYPFVEWRSTHDAAFETMLREVGSRFWLHLGQGWQFFAPEPLLGRLIAVLEAEPTVGQVGINYGDATSLTGRSALQRDVRRGDKTGRYVLTGAALTGPAMYDTTRLDRTPDAGFTSATLDEVLAIKIE